MRYKVKDIGEEGLEVRLPVTATWLAETCPDLEARPAEEGIALAGRLESAGDGYLLRGALTGGLLVPCVRCLEPAHLPLSVEITVEFVEADEDETDDPFAGSDEDGGDVLPFRGGVIDLTDEIKDEILLAIPIGPLCQEACSGICPVCGGNRNAVPCDCEERQRQAASKFAALKDMKV